MAGTINLRVIGTVANDDLPGEAPFDASIDLAQVDGLIARGTQVVGFAAHELLDLGDVASPSVIVIRNLDAANFVEIGRVISAAFEPFAAVGPGELAVIKPAAGQTLYAKADTADVRISRFIPSA